MRRARDATARASRIATVNVASLPAFGPLAALSPALLPAGEGSVESPPERGGSWVGASLAAPSRQPSQYLDHHRVVAKRLI